ncbi:hypothetical protein L7F22_007763 [Adiantum nelumboides]|nr:hypothetical protein [Adiantum nelumboides]
MECAKGIVEEVDKECVRLTQELQKSEPMKKKPELEGTSKSIKLLREVWRDMCKDMSRRLQAQFYESMRDYLNRVAIQENYRSNGVVPTVEEYVALCRSSSGMALGFILIEYGLGMELDEESLQNETL